MTRALLVAVLFAWPGISAAQTTGGITGRIRSAVDGQALDSVAIVATSPALQGEQIALSEPDGTFSLSLLPPGTYTLVFQLDRYRLETVEGVDVELGATTPVTIDLVPSSLEAQTIRVTAEAPTVDRGSTEIGTTVDRDLIETTPHGRSYVEVLRETPGASTDAYGTTVFGSTGVENTYVIEGMNTTDVGYGRAGAVLPVDFFEQIEMKTGGYMPEYGRSMGGIFNLVLRSGGNDYHGDVFVNVAPGFLRARDLPVYRAGDAIGREDYRTLDLDLGFDVGGPIVRDRLWFFVGFAPRYELTDVSRIIQAQTGNLDRNGNPEVREVSREHLDRRRITWQFAGKLTLGITPTQRVHAAYFGNPQTRTGVIPAYDDARYTNGISGTPNTYLGERRFGSHNVVLSYEASLLRRRMEVEAFAGYHTEVDVLANAHDQIQHNFSFEQPLEDVEPGACGGSEECLVSEYATGGTGGYYDERLDRWSGGLRLTNLLARHRVRYGVESEYKVYDSTRGYSGGRYDIDFAPSEFDDPSAHYQDFFAVDTGDPNAPRLLGVGNEPPFNANVSTLTLSAFVQDSWEIDPHFTVNGGVRWDYERLGGVDDPDEITIPDEVAPRFGVSFDPSGVGRGRFFASMGWYFESIPLDINQRSFSQEGTAFRYVHDAPANGDPPTPMCLDPYYYYYYALPEDFDGCRNWVVFGGEDSAVARNLRGQYHEEFVAGVEYEISRRLVVGATGVVRRLQRAIEDISPDGGATYIIANPGEPGPGADFPKPERIYTGFVLSARQRLTNHMQFLASYTISRLEGNYGGLYSADNDQLDPNISSEYDLPDLMVNRYGLLPADRTHQIKIIGSYELGGLNPVLDGLSLGVGYHGESGSPISYLGRHPFYGRNEVFILPRGTAGRTPFVSQVDGYAGYDIPLGTMRLNLNVTVFNVLNFHKPLAVDQEFTREVVSPQPAGTRIEDVPVTPNPTFGEARIRQTPLFVRLGAKLSF